MKEIMKKRNETMKKMEEFLDQLRDGLRLDRYEEFSQRDKFVIRQGIRFVKVMNALAGAADEGYPAKSYRKILNLYLALYKI